jgi:hypothetical protein
MSFLGTRPYDDHKFYFKYDNEYIFELEYTEKYDRYGMYYIVEFPTKEKDRKGEVICKKYRVDYNALDEGKVIVYSFNGFRSVLRYQHEKIDYWRFKELYYSIPRMIRYGIYN